MSITKKFWEEGPKWFLKKQTIEFSQNFWYFSFESYWITRMWGITKVLIHAYMLVRKMFSFRISILKVFGVFYL